MFDDRYHSLMSQNRRLDKSLKHLQQAKIRHFEEYQMCSCWILRICDDIGLKRQTKYLVKKSLDLYALKFGQASPDQLLLAVLGFFFMAVKFNEDLQTQEKITFKWFLENSQFEEYRFQIQDLISFEVQIYNFGEFSLNFTTPYDYLGLYSSTFMINNRMVREAQNILDFSLTIPELMFVSAEELFFGAMLMIARQKNYDQEWILRQTFSREEAEKVCLIIEQYYQRQCQLVPGETSQP